MRPAPVATTGTAGIGAHAVGHATARLPMVTGRFALWAAAVVAVPAIALGVTAGWPAPHSVPVTSVQVPHAVPTTSTSQEPNTPVPESNVPTPEPNTSVPPSAGPANTNNPNINQGTQPIPQVPSPAPAATVIPRERAVTPTSHAAPASLPPAPPIAPPAQEPSQPPAKHCPDGSTVAGGQSCPTPQAPPPPNCPHVAVPGSPICARTAPAR